MGIQVNGIPSSSDKEKIKKLELEKTSLSRALLDYVKITEELLEYAEIHVDEHFEKIETHKALIENLRIT